MECYWDDESVLVADYLDGRCGPGHWLRARRRRR